MQAKHFPSRQYILRRTLLSVAVSMIFAQGANAVAPVTCTVNGTPGSFTDGGTVSSNSSFTTCTGTLLNDITWTSGNLTFDGNVTSATVGSIVSANGVSGANLTIADGVTLTATNSGAYGISNPSGSSINQVTNHGTVTGGVIALSNDGTIGTITNTGNLNGTDVGLINSTGTITSIINQGTIGTDATVGGILNFNTITTLTNLGTIVGTGSWGGINNQFGTIGTLNNQQSGLVYVGTAPTNYNIVIAGTGAGQFGTLVVKNTGSWGNFNTSSSAGFGISSLSTGVAAGTYQDVIQKNGTTTFNGTTTQVGSSIVGGTTWNWHLDYDGTNWDLVINPNMTNTLTYTSSTQSLNPVANGAATVLDANTNISSLFTGMSGAQGYANAAVQALPLLTGNTTFLAQATLQNVNQIIQARLGKSSGNDFYGDQHFWVKPFASRADQSDRNGVAGFKSESYGLAAGFDGTLSPALRVGAALAYARSDVNSRSSVAPQSADVDTYQLIGYGSYALDNQMEIDFQADAGQNVNKGRRSIILAGSTATSDFRSDTAHVGVGLGRTYTLSGSTSLTPTVRMDYTWIKDKAYAETGAGLLNLNVDARSTEALVLSVGGKLAHQLNDQTTLFANLGVGYDTMNKQTSITAAFAGAPGAAFVTYGIDPSPWIGQAGVGAMYKTKSGLELTARYDAEYRESFLNQTASVKARWAF